MSEDSFFHFGTIHGAAGGHASPYMTRIWIGRLRLHVFHRGDADPDPHDHPWDFWTFPLTSYVEEVALPDRQAVAEGAPEPEPRFHLHRRVVPAFRWTFRPAEHTHRVVGRAFRPTATALRYAPDTWSMVTRPGPIVTIVWRARKRRAWGFLKSRDGRWCWVAWRDYVFGGGKHAPCEPSDGGAS